MLVAWRVRFYSCFIDLLSMPWQVAKDIICRDRTLVGLHALSTSLAFISMPGSPLQWTSGRTNESAILFIICVAPIVTVFA